MKRVGRKQKLRFCARCANYDKREKGAVRAKERKGGRGVGGAATSGKIIAYKKVAQNTATGLAGCRDARRRRGSHGTNNGGRAGRGGARRGNQPSAGQRCN